MAININSNMALGSAQYLDNRQSVADLDALLALDTNIIPNGFECYVEALDCKYKYHEDYNETSTGNWKLIGEVGVVKNYLRLKGTVGYEPQMVEITPSLVQSVLTNATSETIEGRWILEEVETNTEIFDADGNFSLPALEKVTITKLDDFKVLGVTDITSTAISCRAITDIDVPFELMLEWKEENGTGHIELTQAEYDALSEEEKLNGAIYFITDAEGGSSEVELTEYSYIIIEPAGSNSVYYSYEDLSTKIGCYVPVTTYNHKYGEWVVNIYVVRQNDEGNIEIINESGYETIIAPIGTGTVVTLPFVTDTRASSQTTWSSKQIASALLGDNQLNEFSNNSVQNWVLAGKFKEIESKLDGENGIATYSSLEELGLTAPTTIGEAFNAMPDKSQLMLNVNNVADADATVTDAPHNQGVLVINKHNNGRFSIEFNYSLGGNGNTIRKWIGTLKGSDGTGLNWKEVAYSNDHGMKSYSSLTDLELDTTATINDIIGKMANTSMFVYKTDVFDLSQYENLQFATVTIIKHSANRVQAIMTDKDTGDLYIGKMGSSNKIVDWTKVATEEIVHTSLSGNLADITTVLDLVNALLTEYRATSPKKPIRFVSGEITKTTLTDLPVTYGILQITVAGWDVVEVRLAHSANGFKTMYYGFMNRISGEESISSITWQAVATTADHNMNTYTNVTQLGLSSPCSVIDIIKKLPKNSQLIYGSYGSETHNGGYITDAPATHGLLEVKKSDYDGCRATMTFTESATNSMGYKRKWIAEFASGSGNIDTNGVKWHEVAYKAVADVGFTTINQTNGLTAPEGITMTDGSKVNYCIRNGICYVHIALQISSISAKVNSWTVIAELPKSVIEAVGTMNCEDNTVPDCMPIRVSQAGKLTVMYKGTTTSTSDWWSYSFSYPVTE